LTMGGRAIRSCRMVRHPLLIGSEIYRTSSYGRRHPLAIPRVSAALDLIRAMGWLDERQYLDSPIATAEQLARFHDRDYIAAAQAVEDLGLKVGIAQQPAPAPAPGFGLLASIGRL
jgi:acetoin utilization deacetylase AcuC-like enzyme